MKLHLIELLVAGTIVAAAPVLAQTYTVQDLGPASGNTLITGVALNDVGQACGGVGTNAVLFSDGQVIDLGGTTSSGAVTVQGIDNSGVVVGFEEDTSTDTTHALLWNNGAVQDITATSLFPFGASARAIAKKSGLVVGAGQPTKDTVHVFTYQNGQTTDIGTDNASAGPFAVNNSGEILVSYSTSENLNGQAIYSNGKFTVINPPANATASANGINDNGVVVGQIIYNTNTLISHAGFYNNGVWTDLGFLPGATRGTAAISINSAGEIVGTSAYQPNYKPERAAKVVASILRNGVWVDLNTLIPTNSQSVLARAVSINDAGQILCNVATPTAPQTYINTVLLSPK